MLWVDAMQVRYMSGLGYLPLSSAWFLNDATGHSVNGYHIPAADLGEIKSVLADAGIYFHE